MTRPVLFVTNHVPPDRVGAFAALHARRPIELALFGGRSTHATAGVADPGVPHRHVEQRAVAALAASGRYAAVVCGTAGRIALPAAFAGARRGRTPFVLWTALWAPLTAPALLPSVALLALLYRRADAVATYGEHVSAYVTARGARRVHIAPQAVDNAYWSQGARDDGTLTLFVGRPDPGKGLDVLLRAQASAPGELVLVGPAAAELPAPLAPRTRAVGPRAPDEVRNFLRQAAVVAMTSVPTPAFREPWGLVANEAMNQRVPVLASDAVGAVAGGLVRHERNGLVVAAGDDHAVAAGLARLHADAALRTRLGAAGARDVAPFTFDAWAAGLAGAIDDAIATRRDYR